MSTGTPAPAAPTIPPVPSLPKGQTKLVVAGVAIFAVIVLVIAIIVLAGGRDESPVGGGAGGTPVTGTGGESGPGGSTGTDGPGGTTGGGEGEDTPEGDTRHGEPSGGLKDLVQEEVGSYVLVDGSKAAFLIEEGASDALDLVYEGPSGGTLHHFLAAFPSPEDAADFWEGFGNLLVNKEGFNIKEQGDVESDEGVVGQYAWLRSLRGAEKEVLTWYNGDLWASAESSQGNVVPFYRQLDY